MSEVDRQIVDSTEASDPGHFHAPGPFASLPSPHPSIYLPSTHPSPLSPLLPCRAGPAFHLLSVPARSSPVHPPLAFTIQLKATTPSSSSLSSSSSHSSSTPSPSLCAWMSTAERPYTPCRDAVMTHTCQAHRWCKHTLTYKYTECVRKSKREGHKEMNTLTHTMIFFFLSSFWHGE